MRGMKSRQAILFLLWCAPFSGLAACSSSVTPTISSTSIPFTPTLTSSATPVPPSPTAAPFSCQTQPGTLGRESLTTTNPAEEYIIYLPPCYFQFNSTSYPVLYLLHGQTYTDDQWIRIGAAEAADRLIISGDVPPFIMVFPDDRGWNLVAAPGFGDRLLTLIPYIDTTYRTVADRDHRALGGLSRGGGWTARLGFTNVELFGALGLHSPAISNEDGHYLIAWIEAIPPQDRPRLWLDVGDRDKELGYASSLELFLADIGFPHEYHVYTGEHTEAYWRLHVEEYLRWYAELWGDQNGDT